MDYATRALILTEFDALWNAARKTPQGPDGVAIKAQVAAKLGIPQADVRTAVLDDQANIAGTP